MATRYGRVFAQASRGDLGSDPQPQPDGATKKAALRKQTSFGNEAVRCCFDTEPPSLTLGLEVAPHENQVNETLHRRLLKVHAPSEVDLFTVHHVQHDF